MNRNCKIIISVLLTILAVGFVSLALFRQKTVSFFLSGDVDPVRERVFIYPYSEDLALPQVDESFRGNIFYINAHTINIRAENGVCVWENAPPGRYWVRVNSQYFDITVPVSFQRAFACHFDVHPRFRDVNITLKDRDGNPVSDKKFVYQRYELDLWQGGISHLENATDKNGQVTWRHAPEGCHYFWVGEQVFPLTVSPNSPAVIDVEWTLQ